MTDWVRGISPAVGIIPSSRSILADTELLCTFHFFLGRGKGALWALSCMTQLTKVAENLTLQNETSH